MHALIYIHGCVERGQYFSDEKPVCLFHIPLVPGATSEGRGSTQTFLQDADVRIKSQTDSCTQQGRKRRRKEGERGRGGGQRKGELLLQAWRVRARSHLFRTCFQMVSGFQRLCCLPLHTCNASWPIVAIVTGCSPPARMMGNRAPHCLHLVPCFSY